MKALMNNLFYVGVNDHDIDLFEGQYDVPNGMAYNSYVIVDDKVVVMDSVETRFKDEWIKNIKEVLKDRKVDYLIVQHMEPDHSSNIVSLMEEYPDVTVVGNLKTFKFFEQFYKVDIKNKLVVNDGDTLVIGKRTLKFVFAPMVHWPEVMFTYLVEDNVLFSADAFGKFGALDVEEDDWACEARRYYFGIVGPFGLQVQNVLKKAKLLTIKMICPLHGPVLDSNLDYYLDLYNTWSSYSSETDGVAIFYTSVYGHTKLAAELLKEELEKLKVNKVTICDLAREDMGEAIEDAFRYSKVVFATTTYDAHIFPFMDTFINSLVLRHFQNKKVGIIENGTWAPMVNKVIRGKLESSKNIEFIEPVITINSALTKENELLIKELAKALL